MRLGFLLKTAWCDIRGTPRRLFVSMLGIVVGITGFATIDSLNRGLERAIDNEFHTQSKIRLVEIRKAGLDLGIIQFDPASLFGTTSGLTQSDIEELRQWPELSNVFPRLTIDFPTGASGGEALVGQNLFAELLLDGLPQELLTENSMPEWSLSEPVPIWVSTSLLEIFNTSVADSLNLPKLSPQLLEGLTFDIIVGRSLIKRSGQTSRQTTLKARIVGTHPNVNPLGAATTLDVAQELIAEFSTSKTEARFTTAILELTSARSLEVVMAKLSKIGLEVDDTSSRLKEVLNVIEVFGLSVAGLFLLMATFSVGQSFHAVLGERRRDLSLYQTLGFTERQLRYLIGLQSFGLGLLGSVIALLLAVVCTESANWFISVATPDFPYKPDIWFVWSGSTVVKGLLLGSVVTSCAGLAGLRGLIGPEILAKDMR